MMRLAAALLLAGTAAQAEVFSRSSDTLELRQGDPWPEVYYSNHAGKQSTQGWQTLQMDGLVVRVHIQVGEAETITVVPVDDQVVAIPPEADVMDGDDITIVLMPPMF